MKRIFDWIFQPTHMEYWFKWLEWVTLTAAISTAFWQTKSMLILPIVVLSVIYVWYSAVCGVGYLVWTILGQVGIPLNKRVVKFVSDTVGSLVGIGVLYILVVLFIGILDVGGFT